MSDPFSYTTGSLIEWVRSRGPRVERESAIHFTSRGGGDNYMSNIDHAVSMLRSDLSRFGFGIVDIEKDSIADFAAVQRNIARDLRDAAFRVALLALAFAKDMDAVLMGGKHE